MRPSIHSTTSTEDIKKIVELFKKEKSFRRTGRILNLSDYQVRVVLIKEGVVEPTPIVKFDKNDLSKQTRVDEYGRKKTLCYCPSCKSEHIKKINYTGPQRIPWFQCNECKNKTMDWAQHSCGGPAR